MSASNHNPSSRARGHGEFLRLWESSAPLTPDQLHLCATIEKQCSNPAAVPGISAQPSKTTAEVSTDPTAEKTSEKLPYDGTDALKGLANVTTAEQFNIWRDEMERRLEEANEEKYRALIDGLRADRAACTKLLEVVSKAEEALERVKSGRQFVENVVTNFKSDCENMVSERKKMGELADALRKRLTYFEELETLTAKFGGGTDAINPTNPDFVKLLHRLDECVAYASSSTGAVAEADGYLARFVELQRRAFTSVRDYTVNIIRDTATQVANELRTDRLSGAGFRHADLTDASKEYLRFRTIAPKVKSLMTELHCRAKPNKVVRKTSATLRRDSYGAPHKRGSSSIADPYSNPAASGISGLNTNPSFSTRSAALSLYADCEECFFEQRKRLLEPSVAAHIKSLADVRNMIALARLGSAYVLQVCQLERQLYEHLFPVEDESAADDNSVLLGALRGVCDMVYTELRPQILQEDDLDKLVYLIEVLKTEILGDEVPRRGFAGTAFAPSAIRAIADAQERIIYRAEVYMRDEIRGFVPKPEHFDYPNRILNQQRQQVSLASSPGPESPAIVENGNAQKGGKAGTKARKENSLEVRSVGIYATWYPPVERTLRLLSMLYRCVDGQVFAGVAQEAVAICVQSVGSAAARIAAQDKPHARDHAQLFLIWQLLMTREQISPFDVDMSYTEHELDFVELRSLLGSVIRGQLSARSLATPPAVRAKVIDSKRELDHRVRGAYESFILSTTRLILDPVLSFLAKSNALPAPIQNTESMGEDGIVPATPPKAAFETLKSNVGSFAHPKRLRETWEKVRKAVREDLGEVVERMKIYITKSASRAVLLRPIRANIAEAATELLSAVQLRYTLEERDMIGIDGAEVGALLDDVDEIMGSGMKSARSSARVQSGSFRGDVVLKAEEQKAG